MKKFLLLSVCLWCIFGALNLHAQENGKTFEITFQPGSPSLNVKAKKKLDSLVGWRAINKRQYVLIYGYADGDGNEKEGKSISDERAECVKKYLLAHGLQNYNFLICTGLGKLDSIGHPTTDNSLSEYFSKVEIITDSIKEIHVKTAKLAKTILAAARKLPEDMSYIEDITDEEIKHSTFNEHTVSVKLPNEDEFFGSLDKKNRKQDYGVYTWANGEKYAGAFKNDKKHGHGVYSWKTGELFEGEWRDDKLWKGRLTEVLTDKYILRIVADRDAKVYINGKLKGHIKRDTGEKFIFGKGTYKLKVVNSTDTSDVFRSQVIVKKFGIEQQLHVTFRADSIDSLNGTTFSAPLMPATRDTAPPVPVQKTPTPPARKKRGEISSGLEVPLLDSLADLGGKRLLNSTSEWDDSIPEIAKPTPKKPSIVTPTPHKRIAYTASDSSSKTSSKPPTPIVPTTPATKEPIAATKTQAPSDGLRVAATDADSNKVARRVLDSVAGKVVIKKAAAKKTSGKNKKAASDSVATAVDKKPEDTKAKPSFSATAQKIVGQDTVMLLEKRPSSVIASKGHEATITEHSPESDTDLGKAILDVDSRSVVTGGQTVAAVAVEPAPQQQPKKKKKHIRDAPGEPVQENKAPAAAIIPQPNTPVPPTPIEVEGSMASLVTHAPDTVAAAPEKPTKGKKGDKKHAAATAIETSDAEAEDNATATKDYVVMSPFMVHDTADGMVYVEGGAFTMGDNNGGAATQPEHSVMLNNYYICGHEVTVSEFERFIKATGYRTYAEREGNSFVYTYKNENAKDKILRRKNGVTWKDDENGNPLQPYDYGRAVLHVSWYDASAYCDWLSKATMKKYHLPTEAEWEYAAIKGIVQPTSAQLYPTLDKKGKLKHTEESAESKPTPADFEVWDWCADWYAEDYYGRSAVINPKGPEKGTMKVQRGGNWVKCSGKKHPTCRFFNFPEVTGGYIGFRIAKTD